MPRILGPFARVVLSGDRLIPGTKRTTSTTCVKPVRSKNSPVTTETATGASRSVSLVLRAVTIMSFGASLALVPASESASCARAGVIGRTTAADASRTLFDKKFIVLLPYPDLVCVTATWWPVDFTSTLLLFFY